MNALEKIEYGYGLCEKMVSLQMKHMRSVPNEDGGRVDEWTSEEAKRECTALEEEYGRAASGGWFSDEMEDTK